MQEQQLVFTLKDFFAFLILLGGLSSAYWLLRIQVNSKVSKDTFTDTINKMTADITKVVNTITQIKSEKVEKDEFVKVMDGIRKDIQEGVKDITEAYHTINTQQKLQELRLQNLEENNTQHNNTKN